MIALVVTAAAEELLPAFFGVGLPLLLAAVMVMATRAKVLPGVLTAVGAGAFEDALSALPPMTSICIFVIASLLSRKAYFPRPFLLLLFPLFEFWTGICVIGPRDDVFVRMLVSLPLGAVALGIMWPALNWSYRRTGLDD